jgi:hypothetical protein
MAIRFLCPDCGRDMDFALLPPRSAVVICACGTRVRHSFASFIQAWWFWFFSVGALVTAPIGFVLQLLGLFPVKSSGEVLSDLLGATIMTGALGGTALSVVGAMIGCAVYRRD